MSTAELVDANHLRRTTDACVRFLSDQLDRDWTAPIPDIDMTVAAVVAHAANACMWYSIDLSAGGPDLRLIEVVVKPDAEPSDLADALRTCAGTLAAVVDAAPATILGFHPWGTADRSGFAAMACDELLIHVDDAARGLGTTFSPDPALATPVLRRLFPWVTPGDDAWAQLKWANGRISLDGNERLASWKWHCAPLAQWQPDTGTQT